MFQDIKIIILQMLLVCYGKLHKNNRYALMYKIILWGPLNPDFNPYCEIHVFTGIKSAFIGTCLVFSYHVAKSVFPSSDFYIFTFSFLLITLRKKAFEKHCREMRKIFSFSVNVFYLNKNKFCHLV